MKRFAQITVLIFTWFMIPATLLLIIGNFYSKQRISTLKANSLRSHDKYTTGEKYATNINSSEVNYLGDICTQSGYLTGEDCPFWDGERKHHFQSDNLGFKTLGNFENSEVVIIGDSFLGATGGDDTKDQLGAVIARKTGKKIYEAAHPGSIDAYIKRHKMLNGIESSAKEYIFLLFEGNDFAKVKEINKVPFAKKKLWHHLRFAYSPILNALNNTHLVKLVVTVNASKNLNPSNAVTKEIKGRIQAFTPGYINNSVQDLSLKPHQIDYFKANADSICGIIIAPTASSVYLENLTFKERHPTLASQLKEIEKSGIKVLNTTNVLKQGAANETDNYKIWWSDDTHWNKNAIEIVANRLIKSKFECMQSS